MNNMEKVYRKTKSGRYISVGFNHIPDISDGIWLVQSNPSSKSVSSLFWKVGDIKRPVDVVTHATLQTMETKLAKYLMALSNTDSTEYEEAKQICGGYLRGPVNYTNISASDIITLILRQIAINIEDDKNPLNK